MTHVIPDNWVPTVDAINALPEPVRRYIRDLETQADPAGDIRVRRVAEETIRELVAERAALIAERDALRAQLAALATDHDL